MTSYEDVLAGHLQELRRGTIVVAASRPCAHRATATRSSRRSPARGSASTPTRSTHCCDASRSRAWLVSEWNTDESRPRKFYRTSTEGLAVLTALRSDWRVLDTAISDLG